MRKRIHRLSILMIVVGILCLVIGAVFALSAFAQYEHQRGRFFEIALIFAGSGAGVLALRFLFIVLPDMLRDRRSGVASRRRDLAKTYKRPKPSPPAVQRDEGGILLLVLVLLGVVTAAAVHAVVSARASSREAAAVLESGLLRLAALDAARGAMQALADDPDLEVDHAEEAWALRREEVDPSGATRLVRTTDLDRAFDVNNLAVPVTGDDAPPEEVAANLLIACGVFSTGTRIDALRDWIDDDSAGPFENDHYARLSPPARPANRILYGWSELMQVEGWTPDLFARKPSRVQQGLFEAELADCLAVIPAPRNRVSPVNINTAEPAVLQALFGFASEGIVERIVDRRRREPFRDTTFLAELLGNAEYRRVRSLLDVRSRFFRIEASAHRDQRSAHVELLAAREPDGRVSVLGALF